LVCNPGLEVRDTTAIFRDTRDGRSAAVYYRCGKYLVALLGCSQDFDSAIRLGGRADGRTGRLGQAAAVWFQVCCTTNCDSSGLGLSLKLTRISLSEARRGPVCDVGGARVHTPFKAFGPGPSAARPVLVPNASRMPPAGGHRRSGQRYVASEAKARSLALRALGLLAEAPGYRHS
jgi:hypothetical protein